MRTSCKKQINRNLLKNKTLLIKVGGNALTTPEVTDHIAEQIAVLTDLGAAVVIVHGGGIEINTLLNLHEIDSEFVDGHRKTDAASLAVIEMALSGKVNKQLVECFQKQEVNAVGLSGKDGRMVTAKRRFHKTTVNGALNESDLGFVGDVSVIDPTLIRLLLSNHYTPVISPISAGSNGGALNVNADMFAGHLAASLQADHFIALTNIDGLLRNPEKPETLIRELTRDEAEQLTGQTLRGGMIPKIEACLTALQHPGCTAHIVNGTKDQQLLRIFTSGESTGTTIAQSR